MQKQIYFIKGYHYKKQEIWANAHGMRENL